MVDKEGVTGFTGSCSYYIYLAVRTATAAHRSMKTKVGQGGSFIYLIKSQEFSLSHSSACFPLANAL